MRIAVVGGTGLVGRHVIDELARTKHQGVVISRSHGVDVVSGKGLDAALSGADAVIDASNVVEADPEKMIGLFAAGTRNLIAAGKRAAVKHHVLLSIVGVDLIKGNAHYAGKRMQEKLVKEGGLPFTIVRATQFHEFAEMVASWTRNGDVAMVPPALVQPIAVADVARMLVEVATGAAQNRTIDIAGPGPEDLFDMARRTLAARGNSSVRLIPSWRNGVMSVEAAGEILLPGADARLATTTFDQWLKDQARSPSPGTPGEAG